MKTKPPDVLSRIPSASVIRERLREMLVETRKLQILLEVAERIESEDDRIPEVTHV
jgi:hypothetical protein